jgi:hypothetical protein
MKRLAFISFVALSVGAMTQATLAADLAVRAPPPYKAPPPLRVFSWTGCFIGGNAGGLWTNREWDDGGIFPGDPFVGQSFGSHNANSWIGGAQIGCDYQFAGGWVVGIQGDYDWTDATGSSINALVPAFTNQTHVKSLASATGRIGYAWDRRLQRFGHRHRPRRLDGQRNPRRMDGRHRRRVCVHGLALRVRRIRLLQLRQSVGHAAHDGDRLPDSGQHQGDRQRRQSWPESSMGTRRLGRRQVLIAREGHLDQRSGEPRGSYFPGALCNFYDLNTRAAVRSRCPGSWWTRAPHSRRCSLSSSR